MLRKSWFAFVVCALVGIAAYLPIVNAEFVWDDSVVQNYQLPYFKSFGDAFRVPKGLVEWGDAYFRPVVLLTYMAEERINSAVLGELGPGAGVAQREDRRRARLPHGATLFYHALTAGMVALLARRLLAGRPGGTWGALAAALVFALHPVHSDSIGSIAGRTDILAALFTVSALYVALLGRDRKSLPLHIGAGILFLLGLMSKEVAIAGLLILPLLLRLIPAETAAAKEAPPPPPPAKGRKRPSAPAGTWWFPPAVFLAVTAVYAVIRAQSTMGRVIPQYSFDVGKAFGQILLAASFYIHEIFVPWPLSPYIPGVPGVLEAVAAWAFGLLLILGAVFAYRKGEKLYVLCLVWFAAAAAPPLYIVIRRVSETVTAERYLYMPSVGFALAVGVAAAALLGRGGKIRAVTAGVLGALLAVYGVSSWISTYHWQDNLSLWQHVTKQKEGSRYSLSWTNLATCYLRLGDMENAERYFQHSMSPGLVNDMENQALSFNGLGVVRYEYGNRALANRRYQEAEQYFRDAEAQQTRAFYINQSSWIYAKNIGLSRLQQAIVSRQLTGRYDAKLLANARAVLNQALRISPGNPEVSAVLAEVGRREAEAAR